MNGFAPVEHRAGQTGTLTAIDRGTLQRAPTIPTGLGPGWDSHNPTRDPPVPRRPTAGRFTVFPEPVHILPQVNVGRDAHLAGAVRAFLPSARFQTLPSSLKSTHSIYLFLSLSLKTNATVLHIFPVASEI